MSSAQFAGSSQSRPFERIPPTMAAPPRSDSTEAVAYRLRLIRLAYGAAQGLAYEMTQAEMGRLTGIGRQAWNNAETGDNRIGVDNAIKLALKTGASLDYIYLGYAKHLPLALSVEIEKLERPASAKRA